MQTMTQTQSQTSTKSTTKVVVAGIIAVAAAAMMANNAVNTGLQFIDMGTEKLGSVIVGDSVSKTFVVKNVEKRRTIRFGFSKLSKGFTFDRNKTTCKSHLKAQETCRVTVVFKPKDAKKHRTLLKARYRLGRSNKTLKKRIIGIGIPGETEGACIDSDVTDKNDVGLPISIYKFANLGVKGHIKGLHPTTDEFYEAEDKCWNDGRILEYFCNESTGKVSWNSYDCPGACVDGACVISNVEINVQKDPSLINTGTLTVGDNIVAKVKLTPTDLVKVNYLDFEIITSNNWFVPGVGWKLEDNAGMVVADGKTYGSKLHFDLSGNNYVLAENVDMVLSVIMPVEQPMATNQIVQLQMPTGNVITGYSLSSLESADVIGDFPINFPKFLGTESIADMCDDPDGNDIYQATSTLGWDYEFGQLVYGNDYCAEVVNGAQTEKGAWVVESQCLPDGKVNGHYFECPDGTACEQGACVEQNIVDVNECNSDYDCNDMNPCTQEICSSAGYCTNPVEPGAVWVACGEPNLFCHEDGSCAAVECKDSDGGINLNEAGETTGVNWNDSSWETKEDYCTSSGKLIEYYCSDGYIAVDNQIPGAPPISSEGTACPSGTACSQGACVGSQAEVGSLSLEPDNMAPEEGIMFSGENDHRSALFHIQASDVESVDLDNIKIKVHGNVNIAESYKITQVPLSDEVSSSTTIATLPGGVSELNINLSNGSAVVPAGSYNLIQISIDVNDVGNVVKNDDFIYFTLESGDVTGTGTVSGEKIYATGQIQSSAKQSVYDTIPQVSLSSSSPTGSLATGMNTLIAVFDVNAKGQNGDLTFQQNDGNQVKFQLVGHLNDWNSGEKEVIFMDKYNNILDNVSVDFGDLMPYPVVTLDFSESSLTVPAGDTQLIKVYANTTSFTTPGDVILVMLNHIQGDYSVFSWGVDGQGNYETGKTTVGNGVFGNTLAK